jgi:transposase-like protein
MKSRESLKALLQLPEMCMVGSAQERAAFTALRIQGQTIREAAQAIGVSKSQVSNLADLFQGKLATKMMELDRKRLPVSKEYLELRRALFIYLHELQEVSGSDDYGFNDTKIGNFSPGSVSREDWAEVRGIPLKDSDE